jgi:hypothetical protein
MHDSNSRTALRFISLCLWVSSAMSGSLGIFMLWVSFYIPLIGLFSIANILIACATLSISQVVRSLTE